jgi:hypothetical protein
MPILELGSEEVVFNLNYSLQYWNCPLSAYDQ